jgi:chromosome segregation ATPase
MGNINSSGPEKGDFTIDSVHRYNKKIESLNYEYNHMLAQTLENQRAYFERRLAELNEEEDLIIAKTKNQLAEAESRLIELDAKTDESHRELEAEKDKFIDMKNKFGDILKEQMTVEAETKRIQQYNQIKAQEIEQEIAKL